MKNNLYIILVFFSTICFSQERDTLTTIDTTKTIKLKEVKITSSLNKAGVYQLLIPTKILENETLEKTIKRVSFITIDNNKNLYFKDCFSKLLSILFSLMLLKISEPYADGEGVTFEDFKEDISILSSCSPTASISTFLRISLLLSIDMFPAL
jgi:hypothetical protein